ncbi:MAG: NADP-dependent phosphogluconate dehydrogenase [Rhizobiales bacterium]|nr:NADP-dependent phosphogluconate dehydrogenase [Hyphomicrobiales bacterium]
MLADIGLVGLGVMGGNLALNMAEKGFTVAVHSLDWDAVTTFVAEAGDLGQRLIPARTMAEFVGRIRAPRSVILLVPAGAVDVVMRQLGAALSRGDSVIDAGNSDYHETERRQREMAQFGVTVLGVGISGGHEGARNGPSIMAGGPVQAYRMVEPVLTAVSAKFEGEACCAWLGPGGAGHFVKTIHNGIEYADIQMIAEIYGVMRDGLGLTAPEMAKVFEDWNRGRLNSYLIEITARVLATIDEATTRPLVDLIVDRAEQKGTGRWAVIEAQRLGVSAETLEAAVGARVLSSLGQQRSAAEKLYAIPRGRWKAPKEAAIPVLEQALFAGKIMAYAQGFAVMAHASEENVWNLPLGTIASIWRAGCIIRSQFLDIITDTFRMDEATLNLLLAPRFIAMMSENHQGLRETVAEAARAGLPVPALSAALAAFDGYRQARGTANLIQGLRDYFGSHSFERSDRVGAQHGPWNR